MSGFEPQEFARYFQLTAIGRRGSTVTLGETGVRYRVAGGWIEVLGIADLGTGLSADPEYASAEDHDNQFDIVIRASSPRTLRALRNVVLPDPRSGPHSPIYNPGGPGTVPVPAYRYTQPSPGQTFPVELALGDPATVSWAAQALSAYDQADDLAVAFRLRHATTGEWRLTSSSASAAALVYSGDLRLVDVPFATNANDSRAVQVMNSQMHPSTPRLHDPTRWLRGSETSRDHQPGKTPGQQAKPTTPAPTSEIRRPHKGARTPESGHSQ